MAKVPEAEEEIPIVGEKTPESSTMWDKGSIVDSSLSDKMVKQDGRRKIWEWRRDFHATTYNFSSNVGLTTSTGTGTSGYIQYNLAHLSVLLKSNALFIKIQRKKEGEFCYRSD